jgi:hypothetical protein
VTTTATLAVGELLSLIPAAWKPLNSSQEVCLDCYILQLGLPNSVRGGAGAAAPYGKAVRILTVMLIH